MMQQPLPVSRWSFARSGVNPALRELRILLAPNSSQVDLLTSNRNNR